MPNPEQTRMEDTSEAYLRDYTQYIVQEAFNAGLDVKLSGTKTTTARSVKLYDASIEIAR